MGLPPLADLGYCPGHPHQWGGPHRPLVAVHYSPLSPAKFLFVKKFKYLFFANVCYLGNFSNEWVI
jgi:hypothetical protein